MTVHVKRYSPPPINRKEILRYAGVRGASPETEALMEECLTLTEGCLRYDLCYAEVTVSLTTDGVLLGTILAPSEHLKRNLTPCRKALLFGATVGLDMDRLIAKYSRISPAKAVLLQAIGAERIESLCNAFCKEQRQALAPLGRALVPRFSPGYGDLPLSLQEELFRLLELPRRIGLSLNESLLMSPSKSVTAIVGIRDLD